jgi:uncharacterized membrane protein
MSHARVRRWLLACVLLFAGLGVLLATARGISVLERRALSGGDTAGPARLEREGTFAVAKLTGIEGGTAEYGLLEAELRDFFEKFDRLPVVTLLHVLPAALFMLLAPLQFSRRVRRRAIAWHRWSGRLIVVLALPIGVSGLFFGVFEPYAGALERSAIALFGAWFLVALVRAVIAVRRRAFTKHREWMIRMFAVALGVLLVRLVALPLAAVTGAGPSVWFGQAVWLGFSSSVALAELWIRGSRRAAAPSHSVAVS